MPPWVVVLIEIVKCAGFFALGCIAHVVVKMGVDPMYRKWLEREDIALKGQDHDVP